MLILCGFEACYTGCFGRWREERGIYISFIFSLHPGKKSTIHIDNLSMLHYNRTTFVVENTPEKFANGKFA